MTLVSIRSWRRPGRLVPDRARRLRAGAVVLRGGECMEWHSTGATEEVVVALRGWVRVEIKRGSHLRRRRLTAGQALFLPMHTPHRVLNVSTRLARYVYVRGWR